MLRRFIVGLGRRAVYVAFMGTKQKRDVITDLNLLQETIWPELKETITRVDPEAEVSCADLAASAACLRCAALDVGVPMQPA